MALNMYKFSGINKNFKRLNFSKFLDLILYVMDGVLNVLESGDEILF